MTLAGIRETVYLDFEFRGADGDIPHPVCMVAKEHKSGREFRIWLDDCPRKKPPFVTGPDVLMVAYVASAEWGCYLALGWPLPTLVIDLYAEFRCATNGHRVVGGRGLLGALGWFGIDGLEAAVKDSMRSRILAGGPYSIKEQGEILNYCAGDVLALERLFPKLIDGAGRLDYALFRGAYTKCIAQMEHAGIPVDATFYRQMVEHRPMLQQRAIETVNAVIPVYDGLTFKQARFERWIDDQGFADGWPQTETGQLSADDKTLKAMAALYPAISPLRETRQLLAQLQEPGLTIGRDGRNRSLLWAFGTITGRNTPSGNGYIFGCPSFMRNLIRPEPGRALIYADWSQQEFGIAAALSGDANMMAAYESGDPYLKFAEQARAVPAGATKESHPRERALYKQAVLATQYQQGPNGLALRIGATLHEAEDLLWHHHRIFRRFWEWSDSVCDFAQLRGMLFSVFGWKLHYTAATTIRTIRNFPMQSAGAAMLQTACVLLASAGVSVIAPIHDALLIECDDTDAEEIGSSQQRAMEQASAEVLGGFRLQSQTKIIRHGERFQEERGADIWRLLQDQLNAQHG